GTWMNSLSYPPQTGSNNATPSFATSAISWKKNPSPRKRPRPSDVLYPLIFQPVFKERVWGGRRLAQLYHKPLPPGVPIGESWEISDRPGDASVIANGPLAAKISLGSWPATRPSCSGAPLHPTSDSRSWSRFWTPGTDSPCR